VLHDMTSNAFTGSRYLRTTDLQTIG